MVLNIHTIVLLFIIYLFVIPSNVQLIGTIGIMHTKHGFFCILVTALYFDNYLKLKAGAPFIHSLKPLIDIVIRLEPDHPT